MDYSTVKKILSRPIAFHRIFAQVAGGATGGLFLSQLWYWHDKTKDENGWIYKTYEDWKNETCLSRSEIDRARRSLKTLEILEEKKEGLPFKLYYRLNTEKLLSLIAESGKQDGSPIGSQFVESCNQFAESGKHSSRIPQAVRQNPASRDAESGKPIYKDTETTTEITYRDYTEREEDAPEKNSPQESFPEQTSQLIGVNRKPDPYFDKRRNLNETRQAIANQHSVKDSPFESVEEMDNFYAYAFAELSKNSKKFRPDIENEAKWMVLRLQRGQDDPRDRQYLSQFRTGLTRVSREDELLAFAEAVQADLMRKYAS